MPAIPDVANRFYHLCGAATNQLDQDLAEWR